MTVAETPWHPYDPSCWLTEHDPALAPTAGSNAQQRCAWFHNALRILLNIDAIEFPGPTSDWTTFRDNPWRYFIQADDIVAAKLYAIIEARKAFPI